MCPALLRNVAVACWLAAALGGAHAELRASPGTLVTSPTCRVEPFADGNVVQYVEDVARPCSGEATNIELETPRERAGDSGPGLMKAQAQRLGTRVFGPFMTTFKLARARGGESDLRLRTEQAVIAAGGLLRLDHALAPRAPVGRDNAGEARNRARFASLWQPQENSLLFAEWAGSNEQTDHQSIGMRWYLIHKRIAIDIAARRTPWSSGWAEPRIGLLLPGLGQ